MRHHLLHYVALPLGLATLIACGGAPAAASTATTSVPLPATSVSTAVPASEIAAAPAAVTVSATSEATAPSAAPAGFPVSVENCGRTLRFDRPPARIVTSFQTAAEAVVALGEAEKLVGLYFGQVHDLPPAMTEAFKHIPTLGERGYPSSEVVLNARPDLFLAYDPAATATP